MNSFYHLDKLKLFFIDLGEKILDLQKKKLTTIYKEDKTMVCEADFFCDQKISQYLKKHHNYAIISEENPNQFLDEQLTWVVDPIDGTSHFLKKKPDFSLMLGLIKNKEILFSLIYVPSEGKGYYAEKNQGAYIFYKKNKQVKKIQVDKNTNLGKRSFLISSTKGYQKELDWFQEKTILNYKIKGSIGLKLCQIAEGKAHYYLNTNSYLKIWDVIPPQLIIKEAGGFISNIYGEEIEYSNNHYQLKEGLFVAPDKLLKNSLKSLSIKK